MRIIARKTLLAFISSLKGSKEQAAVKAALESWFHEARHAKWRSWADVRRQYATASHVGDRIVFNIKGNDYRLVVAVDYQRQGVWIKWIGTHAQYDKINVREVKYGD